MAFGSVENNLKSGLTDIELKPKQDLVYKDTDTEGRIQKQKSEFLTLLTTQLKNQDPFQPMDTNTMAQQIFSINQVEQQLETNKILTSIRQLIADTHTSNSLNYMGKTGFFEGSSILISDTSQPALLKYLVAGEAESATVRVFNSKGQEMHSETVKVQEGKNGYIWQPKADTPLGVYKYIVELKSKSEKEPASVKTYGFGKIQGITTEEGKNVFEVNGEQIPAERFVNLVENAPIFSQNPQTAAPNINTIHTPQPEVIQSTSPEKQPVVVDQTMSALQDLVNKFQSPTGAGTSALEDLVNKFQNSAVINGTGAAF